MDKLKESIKNPTWRLLYLGVQYNLLSPREAMELVDNNLLDKLDENQIGILYSLDEGKSSFLSTLEELNLYHQTDLKAAKNEWEAIVLRNISYSVIMSFMIMLKWKIEIDYSFYTKMDSIML